jgi:hypothetical protein
LRIDWERNLLLLKGKRSRITLLPVCGREKVFYLEIALNFVSENEETKKAAAKNFSVSHSIDRKGSFEKAEGLFFFCIRVKDFF